MDNQASRDIKCAAKANADKRNWINLLQDIWDYCFPMKHGFYHEASGEERMEKIFDETPIDAANEFASIIMEGLFGGKWFRLVPGPDIPPEQKLQVQRELDVVNEYVYGILDQSNLKSEAHNGIQEMAASVGNLYIKEGDVTHPVVSQNVSMIHLEYKCDAMGRIDTVYRRRKIAAEDIKTEYPKAELSNELGQKIKQTPKKMLKFLEVTERDWQEIGTETHNFRVNCVDTKETIFTDTIKGHGSRPWINFRWAADYSSPLGRGPLVTCLPTIRNLNLVKEMGLENAQLHIGGVFQADDDGTYNFDNIEIVPMSVMSRMAGTKGLEPVSLPGNPDFQQFVIAEMQNTIRMILLNNEFGDLAKTPRSVEEITGRTGKQLRKIRAPLERLVFELVIPAALRILHILKQAGRIEIPKVDGKQISVIARGPLIRMLKALDNEDMVQFVSLVKQTYGEESRLYIHDDKFVSHLGQNFEIPSDILVTDTERKVILDQMRDAAASLDEQIEGEQAPTPVQPPPTGIQ